MQVAIIEQRAIPGLAEIVGPIPEDPREEEVESIAHAIEEHSVPLRSTMGAGDWDSIRSLIARIRGREPIAEFEPTRQWLTWFECHVPPEGKTSVKLQRSAESTANLGFRIFGSGLGTGREVHVEIVDRSTARDRCATYRFEVVVQPRVFAHGDRRSTEVTVVEILGTAIESLEQCAYCGVDRSTLNPFAFRLEQYLDLRADDCPASRTFKVEVEQSHTVDAGFEVPGIPAKLSLQAGVVSSCTLEVENQFPPGVLYQPYRRKSGGPLQTAMWAIER